MVKTKTPMEVTRVYVPKANLVKTVGKDFQEFLSTFVKEGILLSFTEVYELRFEKEKALHIQTALEFYEVQSSEPNLNPRKKEPKE